MSQAPADRRFAHRANADGSIDSICTRCFRTVATQRSEAELDRPERDHVCQPEDAERTDRWVSELPRKGVHNVISFPARKGSSTG
jgi:hypothetical protein